MQLNLGVCVIRAWRESDAPSLVRHANSTRVWRNLRDGFPHPYTEIHASRFLADAIALEPPRHFAIVVDRNAVGGIGYQLDDAVPGNGAELGYWLHESYWGRGIGTAVVSAVTAFAFDVHSPLDRIYAVAFAWNGASARVLEKCGYTLERTIRRSALKDGRAVDQVLYAIAREGGKNRHVSDR